MGLCASTAATAVAEAGNVAANIEEEISSVALSPRAYSWGPSVTSEAFHVICEDTDNELKRAASWSYNIFERNDVNA